MKLVHFADLHIGVENHGRPDPTTGLSTRLLDFLAALDELVQTALAEQADAVIFAGDAYKSRNPEQTHQREFAKRVMALVNADIPVYLLVGNHDVPNMLTRANAVEIFKTLGVDRVVVGERPGLTVIPTRAGPLQVVGLPWPSVGQFLTRDDAKNLPIDQVDAEVARRLTDSIDRSAEQLDPALPAILVAHVAMSNSIVKTASEHFMTVGRYPQLNRGDLRPDAFDYIALGHHHCYQMLQERPPMVYPGSMQRIDFGEEDDPKGFVVVDLDPAKPRGERVGVDDVHFREVKARRFLTIAVTPRDDDPTPEVLRRIERADVADAVVRVQLTLNREQNRLLDERAIRQALSAAHVVAAVSRAVEHGVRGRLGSETPAETLNPYDAVAAWFKQSGMAPDRQAELLGYARAIIDDEQPEPAAEG